MPYIKRLAENGIVFSMQSTTLTDFTEMVRKDPLFAAEGLDTRSALEALDIFEQTLGELQEGFSRDSLRRRLFFLRYPVARYVVPLSFQRAFISCEELRRFFLHDPTEQNALKLAIGWRRAARMYRRGVINYARMYRFILKAEPALASKTIQDMAGNTFTAVDLRREITTLEDNAETLLKESSARVAMLSGGAVATLLPRPSPVERLPQEVLPEEFQTYQALEEEALTEEHKILERHGPLSCRLSLFDGVPTSHQFMFYITRHLRTGEIGAILSVADSPRFMRLGNGSQYGGLGRAIFEPIERAGIKYFPQSLTWLYAVRDQQYWFDIMTLVDLGRRPELNQDFLHAQKSSLFDLMLWRMSFETRRYIELFKVRRHLKEKGYSLGYGFLMRSLPSIFFMPFNRSVWRIERPVSFVGSGRVAPGRNSYIGLHDILPGLAAGQLRMIARAGILRRQEWRRLGITD